MTRYIEAYSRDAAVGAIREWFPCSQFPWIETRVGAFMSTLYFPHGGILEIMDRGSNDPRPGYAILVTSPMSAA